MPPDPTVTPGADRDGAAMARLEERSAAERAELDRRLDARWHAILNEPPDVAPREVLAVANEMKNVAKKEPGSFVAYDRCRHHQ